MEDNRKFATFFADAPKGKKIGAVLSWIATVILLVALFVPGYQLRYQMKTEKGTFKDIPATMTSELKQMKEEAKLNFQFGAGTTSDKIDEFVEKGSTSVFSYLVSPDLQKARLVNLESMSDAPDDISKICVALLVLFFVLVVVAAIASVFTISWCALAANLIGIIELLAVYFFVFAGKFSIDPTDTSITSRVAPALTMILIVLLVLTAIMSVASVIVSYAVHTIRQFSEFLPLQAVEKACSSAHCQYSGVLRSDARTSDFSAHGCVQQTSSRIFLCSRANLLFMCCKCGKEWTPIVFLLLFYPR